MTPSAQLRWITHILRPKFVLTHFARDLGNRPGQRFLYEGSQKWSWTLDSIAPGSNQWRWLGWPLPYWVSSGAVKWRGLSATMDHFLGHEVATFLFKSVLSNSSVNSCLFSPIYNIQPSNITCLICFPWLAVNSKKTRPPHLPHWGS